MSPSDEIAKLIFSQHLRTVANVYENEENYCILKLEPTLYQMQMLRLFERTCELMNNVRIQSTSQDGYSYSNPATNGNYNSVKAKTLRVMLILHDHRRSQLHMIKNRH
jgi:hypothetical protein